MKEQKNKARSSGDFNIKNEEIQWTVVSECESKSIGYNSYSCISEITSYSANSDIIYIQLNKTPFYFESGGQVADTGRIFNKDFTLKVLDVQKIKGKICRNKTHQYGKH